MTVELAEQMVLELQKQTRMTLQYAKDCLEQVNWDFNKALEVFGNVRASLPAEAFVPVA
jgi:nuclear RNA export factor